MRTSIKNFAKTNSGRVSWCCVLLFLFFIFSFSPIIAQDSNAVAQQDSNAMAGGNDLLKNMKKTGSVMTEEVRKMKERQAHEEFMGYVYMVLGFSLVLALAWFLVIASNKRKAKADEKKRIFLENKVANQPKSAQRSAHRRGRRR